MGEHGNGHIQRHVKCPRGRKNEAKLGIGKPSGLCGLKKRSWKERKLIAPDQSVRWDFMNEKRCGFPREHGGCQGMGKALGGVLLGCTVPYEPLWGQSEGITGGRKGEDETLDRVLGLPASR